MPCIFIRLTGCNLNCSYCDTEYAKHDAENLTIDEILETISQYDCKLVEITGGEPLLQENLYGLIDELLNRDYKILIETNGSQLIAKLPKNVIKILDWKTPGSGEENSFDIDNLKYLTIEDEIKFVLADCLDYQWSKDRINDYNLAKKCSVLMSVVKGKFDPAKLCESILKDNLPVRFQLQLHKYVWSNDEKGK